MAGLNLNHTLLSHPVEDSAVSKFHLKIVTYRQNIVCFYLIINIFIM